MLLKALLSFIVCLGTLAESARATGNRIALVIGINNYFNGQNPLNNPVRDAQIIAASLVAAGFKLHGGRYHRDLTKSQMESLLLEFNAAASGAEIAAVYFSGHGAQVDGLNYLMLADTRQLSPGTIALQTVEANQILNALAGATNKILWLDACRNNPFLERRSQSRGLAAMNGSVGTLIGYATHPGTTATDGPAGGNSPYAVALARAIKAKGLDVFAMHMQVGAETYAATGNEQLPWIAAANVKPYHFLPPEIGPVANNTPRPSPPPTVETDDPYSTVGVGGSSGTSVNYIPEAMTLLERARYLEARATLRNAIVADRNNYLPFRYMGYAFLREGIDAPASKEALEKYKAGLPYLAQAIKAKPDDAVSWRHYGNMTVAKYRSNALLNNELPSVLNDGINFLKEAERLDTTSYRNAAALGFAYLLRGYYHDAIRQFDKALALNNTYAVAYSGRCMAKRQLGRDANEDARIARQRDSRLSDYPCLNMTPIRFWGFSSQEI